MNIFERASRGKIRFTYKGQISTEDLWDLRVEELDAIYKKLNKKVKALDEESLLDVKTEKDTLLTLKVDIIKHIVTSKLFAKANAEKAQATKQRKQQILELLAKKQNAKDESKTEEELLAELEQL